MFNVQENVSLKSYNTFGVTAVARFMVVVTTEAELLEALAWQATQPDCPLLILGGGSNLLFTQDWPGLVIKLALKGHRVIAEDDETIEIQFAAGESWHEAVIHTVEQGWGGLENLSLIPGQVGTTPVQNIGAYGVEVKDTITKLEAVNIDKARDPGTSPGQATKVFTNKDCKFGYRDSVFKKAEKGKWVITSVNFKLAKKPVLKLDYGAIKETLSAQNVENPNVQNVSEAVISIRQSKLPDPVEIGNGGSFFKNPIITQEVLTALKENYPKIPYYQIQKEEIRSEKGEISNFVSHTSHLFKIPAAWLIDTAGWKGYKTGNAGVHDKQALVLVNHGGATGADIWQLAQDIMQDIETKFGIRLEPEINII